MPSNLPEVLTIRETSQYLRIPLRSMYKLAQEGKVPCQKIGKHWRFHRETLEQWLKQQVKWPPLQENVPAPSSLEK